MILITGAYGQVGKILQKQLSADNELILVDKNHDKKFNSFKHKLLIGDLQDIDFVKSIFKQFNIKSVFNLATNSFVERDNQGKNLLKSRCKIFDNIINSIDSYNLKKNIWIFHPLSSEIFGVPNNYPQDFSTKISPINEYGFQKSSELIKCRYLVNNGYNIFHPILYNHESKYRSMNFFSKKVISFFINFQKNYGNQVLNFYNSNSSRDFGYAYDFVELFLLAKKKNIIGDEIVGTGTNIKIIDFIKLVMDNFKINYKISYENNLAKIYSDNVLIATELDNNVLDSKRKFCFNGNFLNKDFNKIDFNSGKKLISKLINDEK